MRAVGCSGTYLTHAQTCDNVRVQSATQWTASVPSATQWTASVHTLHIAQTCDNVRVPPAAQWTASVHTHAQKMPKPVITFVFKMPFFQKSKMIFFKKPLRFYNNKGSTGQQ